MNTPISFEIAKVLKEKGFDLPCRLLYKSEKELEEGIGVDYDWNRFDSYSAPTIAEVVMWLYEKHGIWVSVYTMDKWLPNGNDKEQLFDYSLKQMKRGLIDIPKKPEEFNSPTEAYLQAIEYPLKNLI